MGRVDFRPARKSPPPQAAIDRNILIADIRFDEAIDGSRPKAVLHGMLMDGVGKSFTPLVLGSSHRRHSTATEDVWFGYWYGRQRTLCRCAYEPSKARSTEHLMLGLVPVTL